MDTSWIYRRFQYLLLNPKYFFLYIYGKPEKVLNALTGTSKSRFFELKEELDSDPGFSAYLSKKTFEVINKDFKLNIDHYFLYALVREIKPAVILETGVFHGYYTACMLKGLHDNFNNGVKNGKIISIDLPAYKIISESTSEIELACLPKGFEPGWVIPEYLKYKWKLHVGDSKDLLTKILKEEKNISLFFHDSLHTYSHMTYEFETVFPNLKKGSYLMSHDIHWNRAFNDFVRKYRKREFSFHGFGIFKI